MGDLIERFRGLEDVRQSKVLFALAGLALDRWSAFADQAGTIRYVESIVGTAQSVDVRLPHDAMTSARAGKDLADVDRRYLEPIAALQDDDLEWEDTFEFAYYAVYNLFRKFALGDDIDPWIIANQSLASLGPTADIRAVLEDVMDRER